MAEERRSERPSTPAELNQELLSLLQRDLVVAAAVEKEKAAQTADAFVGQLYYDFVVKEEERKRRASHLAGALLNKVSRDFGSVPPPPVMSVTTESDAELEAAANAPLSADELAEIEAMKAPKGMFEKLMSFFTRK